MSERMMLKLLESRKRELNQRIAQFRDFIREAELDLEETEEQLASYRTAPQTLPMGVRTGVVTVTTAGEGSGISTVLQGAEAAAEVEGATPKRGRGRPPKAATAPAPAPETEPAPAPPAGDEDEDDSDPSEPPTFNADGSPF